MRIAVAADGEGGGWLQELGGARPEPVADLAAAVRAREAAPGTPPRWVWTAWEDLYPDLVRAGVRVRRCHDAALTEALLLGHAGRHEEPHSLGAAWARLHGLPVPEDPVRRTGEGAHAQPALFEADRSTLPRAPTASPHWSRSTTIRSAAWRACTTPGGCACWPRWSRRADSRRPR